HPQSPRQGDPCTPWPNHYRNTWMRSQSFEGRGVENNKQANRVTVGLFVVLPVELLEERGADGDGACHPRVWSADVGVDARCVEYVDVRVVLVEVAAVPAGSRACRGVPDLVEVGPANGPARWYG